MTENTRFTNLLLTLQLYVPETPLRSPQNAVLRDHPPRTGRSLGSLPAETRLGDRYLQAVHIIHPVELRDLSALRVLDVTAATLENHLVPSIADAGHRHTSVTCIFSVHLWHLHVVNACMCFSPRLDMVPPFAVTQRTPSRLPWDALTFT